ncbi:MAG: tRNA threonylcarbamoyladenosine dehydratase, partial [Agathobacter sp.]|nr:tRNA threonylcarbamoyladenosine dehydratase [Agathobacter sp.]
MKDAFTRTQMLLGEGSMERLRQARVAIFGLGGVGGYVVEALARSGVGSFVLVDHDTVAESNINRQIIATTKTVGRDKADVMAERISDINPEAQVEVRKCFFLPENADSFDFSGYSYVVDAVDTVTAKLEIILRAQAAGVPVISSMGTGNKLDPTKLQVADIYKTSVCPLAKVMRHELRKRGVKKLKVVYSTELPRRPLSGGTMAQEETGSTGGAETVQAGQKTQGGRRSFPGSVAFVPPAAGLILAGEVVRDLIL